MPLPAMEGKDFLTILLFFSSLYLGFRTFLKDWRDGKAAKKKLEDTATQNAIEAKTAPAREALENLELVNKALHARIAVMEVELADKADLEKENRRLEKELLQSKREWFQLKGAQDDFERRLRNLETHGNKNNEPSSR